MIQDLAEYDLIKQEFKANLKWFEEEFDELFSSKVNHFSPMDFKLTNEILDIFSQLINEYRDEELLFELVETLNRIEKNHPNLFYIT